MFLNLIKNPFTFKVKGFFYNHLKRLEITANTQAEVTTR